MSVGTDTDADLSDTQTRLRRITRGIAHDPLTGLRSHAGLLEEMARDPALANLVDGHASIVVRVELPIVAADKISALVGMRIARSIRLGDTAAHTGSGEFVVIVAGGAEVPVRTAVRLKLALSLPYVIDGVDVPVPHTVRFARLSQDHFVVHEGPLPPAD